MKTIDIEYTKENGEFIAATKTVYDCFSLDDYIKLSSEEKKKALLEIGWVHRYDRGKIEVITIYLNGYSSDVCSLDEDLEKPNLFDLLPFQEYPVSIFKVEAKKKIVDTCIPDLFQRLYKWSDDYYFEFILD